jgi:hypothetical protein
MRRQAGLMDRISAVPKATVDYGVLVNKAFVANDAFTQDDFLILIA